MAPERVVRDGLPVWWAEGPEPFCASLHVRVGHADEPPHLGGVTHLVEHLVMGAAGRPEHNHNAYVSSTECVFFAEGERDEVLAYMRAVGAAVAALDMAGLEIERRILRAEAAQRGPDVFARLLAMRFGLEGYGQAGDAELGLRWVGEAEVREWWAAHFTRGNAALWMTGEPPADLGFTLPEGARVLPPEPAPLPMEPPAFIADGTGGVAVAGLATRSPALALATNIAEERLYERLRRRQGLAYAPYADYRPIGRDHAHVVLGSDGRDEDAERLLEELWACVGELASDGAAEEELDRARRADERNRRDPHIVRPDLAFCVERELLDRPQVTPEEIMAQRAAVDGAAVAGAVRELLERAIVLGPDGSRPLDGLRPIERAVRESLEAMEGPEPPAAGELEGEKFLRPRAGVLRRRPDEDLWVGEQRLGWRTGEERMTIAWDDVVAAEMRPDRSLRVIARDGRWLEISPYQWDDGERAVELARGRVRGELVVPAGEAGLCAAIDRAVERRISEIAAVAGPLDALPDELSPEEGLLDLVVATRTKGFVVGLLVLTERRVLWLASLTDDRLVLARRDVTSARASSGELRLEHADGDVKFVIAPKAAAAELAAAIPS